jgi:WD40 repeat protein
VTEAGLDADGRPFALSGTPCGDQLLSQHNFPESALIGWRPATGGWEREWSVSTKRAAVFTPTLSPDGGRVAMVSWEAWSVRSQTHPARLELRSAVSGALTATSEYPPYSQEPDVLVFSPDGSRLVAVHKTTLLVWPVPELGEPRVVRNDTRKHFTAAAFHPSGRYLFATSNDTTAHVFETAAWQRVARFTWDVGRLRSVAVSPDGALAAAGGDQGEVVIWDVDE